jgi:hypothetical protein
MRKDGFIFIELLLALAISAIAISLFWQSSNNRIRMLSILEEKYAFSRLSAVATIIRASGESINIEPSHYFPLRIEQTPSDIKILSEKFKGTVLLK